MPSTGRPRRSQNPFLLPGGPGFGPLFGGLDPFANDEPDEAQPAQDEKLGLDNAPDPYVFVHARADKLEAVVGEQVTVSFYVYHRASVAMDDRRDPSAADFLRWSMLSNPGAEPLFRARAGGQTYTVQLAERLALFPTRAGELHVGALSYWFTGRQIGRHALRASEDIVLRVTEPPRDERPAGYVARRRRALLALGDGRAAPHQPRRLRRGDGARDGQRQSSPNPRGPGAHGRRVARPGEARVHRPASGHHRGVSVLRVRRARQGRRRDRPRQDRSAALGSRVEEVRGRERRARHDRSHAREGDRAALLERRRCRRAPPAEEVRADPFTTLPAPRASLGAFERPAPPLFEGLRLYLAVLAPPLAYALLRRRRRLGDGASAYAFARARSRPRASPSLALDEADRAAAALRRQGGLRGRRARDPPAIDAARRAQVARRPARRARRPSSRPRVCPRTLAARRARCSTRPPPCASIPTPTPTSREGRRAPRPRARARARAPRPSGARHERRMRRDEPPRPRGSRRCGGRARARLRAPSSRAEGRAEDREAELFRKGAAALAKASLPPRSSASRRSPTSASCTPTRATTAASPTSRASAPATIARRSRPRGRGVRGGAACSVPATSTPTRRSIWYAPRSRVAERAARKDVQTVRPTLDRGLIGLASETTFGACSR